MESGATCLVPCSLGPTASRRNEVPLAHRDTARGGRMDRRSWERMVRGDAISPEAAASGKKAAGSRAPAESRRGTIVTLSKNFDEDAKPFSFIKRQAHLFHCFIHISRLQWRASLKEWPPPPIRI